MCWADMHQASVRITRIVELRRVPRSQAAAKGVTDLHRYDSPRSRNWDWPVRVSSVPCTDTEFVDLIGIFD